MKLRNLRCALSHFRPSELRDHYASEMYGWFFEVGGNESHISLRMKLLTAWDVLKMHGRAAWCDLFGHNWEAVSADAENGSEELECLRCHMSHTCWF